MEFQNASTVWPESVRPEASVMVPGDQDRQVQTLLVEHAAHGEQRGLGIERVEDGLDQQHVYAAGDQRARGLAIGRDELVEIDVAEGRVVDVGRQRGRAVGGAERAGHEARLAVARRVLVGHAARQARGREVELADQALEP